LDTVYPEIISLHLQMRHHDRFYREKITLRFVDYRGGAYHAEDWARRKSALLFRNSKAEVTHRNVVVATITRCRLSTGMDSWRARRHR
jgi:hypothetical protein